MKHAIEEQERIIDNIKSMYSNIDELTTKTLSVEEFQKSYPVEDFSVITNDIMKSYAIDVIKKSKDLDDKKDNFQKAADEINSYEKVFVKADNGIREVFYVKEKVKIDD